LIRPRGLVAAGRVGARRAAAVGPARRQFAATVAARSSVAPWIPRALAPHVAISVPVTAVAVSITISIAAAPAAAASISIGPRVALRRPVALYLGG